MNLQHRIDLMIKLGGYLQGEEPEWLAIRDKARIENGWFSREFIDLSLKNIAGKFLERNKLENWINKYSIPEINEHPLRIGIVMAGNLPLVGFHDFLCGFISGHKLCMKLSSKDQVLLPHLVARLCEWEPQLKDELTFSEMLKDCDAYIATGSNNSGRYFEYYFAKYPHIIRLNRTSVAILDGTETDAQLSLLADDIQLYFGLGCRNVSKLYVPENYDFLPLLSALKRYDYLLDYHKYKHNYDYQLALLMMSLKKYMTSGAVLLSENTGVFSAVSHVYYEIYQDKNLLIRELQDNPEIQCIVAKEFVPFGLTQQPELADYADGRDTLQFLLDLGKKG